MHSIAQFDAKSNTKAKFTYAILRNVLTGAKLCSITWLLSNATKMRYLPEITQKGMQTEEIGCKELSERTGISVTSLYRKLRGESLFNIEEAGRICRALRIPPEEIAVFFTAFPGGGAY